MATSGRDALLKAQIKAGQKELLKLVKEARVEIESLILKAASNGNFIKAAVLRDRLYSGIAEQYIKLNNGVDDWVLQRGTIVAKAWHGFAIDDLPKGATGITFNQFSEKYFNDIIGAINPSTVTKKVALNSQIGGMLAQDIRAVRTAVSETIRTGALTGESGSELQKQMLSKATEISPAFQFIDKAGKTWSSASYFSMLNHTLHANIARETYQDTVIDSGFDLIRVTGTSTYPDSPCIPWQGAILSISGTSKKYPSLAEAEASGLYHINCVHDQMLWVEGVDPVPEKRGD